jgi:uncharacterized membrane protein
VDGQRGHLRELKGGGVNRPAKSWLRRLEHHIWRRMLAGIVVLIPLLITLLTLRFVIVYLDGIYRPIILGTRVLRDIPFIQRIPGPGVVVTVTLLYIIGSFFAGRRSQAMLDAVLTRVPVVRSIYGVARQATSALSSQKGEHFSRVVFVDWPRPGVKALGFVTGHVPPGKDGTSIAVVYIPTVPNPMSGFLAWVPEDEVMESGYSVEDAMKAVLSGGIVLPDLPDRRDLQGISRLDDSLSGKTVTLEAPSG